MKNILIFFVIILCLGCSNIDTEYGVTQVKLINRTSVTALYIVEIEGHQYILYNGITHAEHCPCKNTNN